MATAHVNEIGIVFRGFNPLNQTPAWWDSLLDELKAHHVPGLQPTGKRLTSTRARVEDTAAWLHRLPAMGHTISRQ